MMSREERTNLPLPVGNNRLDDLISRLKESRNELEAILTSLPSAALAWQPIPSAESIGALLLHIANTEACWLGEKIDDEGKKYLWEDSQSSLSPSAPSKSPGWFLDYINS